MADIVVRFEENPTVVKLSQGVQGIQGEVGAGIAPGGNTGQLLKKNSLKNYDTVWTDAVLSVNGKVGNAELDYKDVGAASAAQGALADTALQAVPDDYRTAVQQDIIDATKLDSNRITYGTIDMADGTSDLKTGVLYFYYE